MKKQSSPIKIALDSDMLRNIAYFCDVSNRTYNVMNNQHVYHNLEDYHYLLTCFNSGLIEFRIGKVVFKENNHLEAILNFIKNYKIKSINAPEHQVLVMAQAYCSSYTDINKVKHPAPMNKEYIAADDEFKPSNDAFIMAEATIGNCLLLTNNFKHFISFSEAEYDHRRADGIKCINKQFKFDKIKGNKVFTPQPLTLKTLVKFLKAYIPTKTDIAIITEDEHNFNT